MEKEPRVGVERAVLLFVVMGPAAVSGHWGRSESDLLLFTVAISLLILELIF